MLFIFIALGIVANLRFGYFFVILLSCAALIYQIKQSDFSKNASTLFKNNIWIGAGIALAILIG
jgi:4-hydroxybenzoate polyprenyltransferase